MTPRRWLVEALLRCYPVAWRREYGAELADVIANRPVTAHVVADVTWAGLRERARSADAAVFAGLAVMLVVLGVLVDNLRAPALATDRVARLLIDSTITLPTVRVAPLASEWYVVLLLVCGAWTQVRHRGSMARSGRSALTVGLIAGLPVVVLGISIGLGSIHVHTVTSGPAADLRMVFPLTYTYVSARAHAPSALAIATAPLFQLGQAWVWGYVGGRFGQLIAKARHLDLVTTL